MNGNLTDSPLHILQAANLFVFTMNNPVRWTDPTGLFAQGAFINQAATQAQATARAAGVTGFALANAAINAANTAAAAWRRSGPISITWSSPNDVNITAHVNIHGSGANLEIDNSGMTYRGAAIQGIRDHWSGIFAGRHGNTLNVTTTVIQLNASTQMLKDQGQQFLNIDIQAGRGYRNGQRVGGVHTVGGEWSTTNAGSIVLYTHTTLNNFRLITAHEFGHALGVGDSFCHSYASVMNSGLRYMNPQGATRLDIELALRAHGRNQLQEWSEFNWQLGVWQANPLVRIHGVRR